MGNGAGLTVTTAAGKHPRRLSRQAAELLVGLSASQLATGLLILVFARQASPNEVGAATATWGVWTVATDLADLGSSGLIVRGLARGTASTEFVTGVVRSKSYAAIILAIVGASLMVALSIDHWLLVLAPWFWLTSQQQTVLAILRGHRRTGSVAAVQGLDRCTALIVFVVLLLLDLLPLAAFTLSLVAGQALAHLLGLRLVSRMGYRWNFLPSRPPRQLIREGAHFTLSAIGSDIQLADTAVVAAVTTSATAAMFALPIRFTGPLGIASTALSSALFATAAAGQTSVAQVRKALKILAVLAAITYGFVAAFAHTIIQFAVGARYLDAVVPLQVISAAMVAAALNQPLAAWLQAHDHDRYVARATLVGIVAEFLLLVPLSITFGASGAASAFLLMQLGVLVCFVVKFGQLEPR